MSKARVTIRSAGYLKGYASEELIPDVETDSEGIFTIDDVPPGTYHIEVNNDSSHAVLFSCSVNMFEATVDCGTHIAKPHGSVKGKIDNEGNPGMLAVYGLERNVTVDSSGLFSLSDLPESDEYIFVFIPRDSVLPLVESETVQVTSDALSVPEFPSRWTGRANIYINTTATGSNITTALTDFPLAVQLDETNFSFSEALPGGEDILFEDSTGIPLPFHIELWDSEQQSAVLWVTIPHIAPQTETQYIIMRWGNPEAIAVSNSSAVFDTTSGFRAVWHLTANTGVDSVPITDATFHGNNGFGHFFSTSATVKGVTGNAIRFDGNATYISVPHAASLNLGSGDFTISTWVRFNSFSVSSQQIISKYDGMHIEQTGYEIQTTNWNELLYTTNENGDSGWVIDSTVFEENSWYHLTYTRENGIITTYRNGIIDTIVTDIPVLNVDNTHELRFGRDAYVNEMEYLNGIVDETRISAIARTPSWIKLCYESQKEGQTVVTVIRY
jgi:hypothetical protein